MILITTFFKKIDSLEAEFVYANFEHVIQWVLTNVNSNAPITTNTIKNHPQSSLCPLCFSPLYLQPLANVVSLALMIVWVFGFFCLFVLEFHWNGITMCSSSRLALLLGIMHWDSSMLPWIALCLLVIHFYCWLGFYSGMYHRVSLLWFMDTWIISSLSYYK